MEGLAVFNGQNWESEVLLAEGPVLVDFRAPWCDPGVFRNGELEDFCGSWKNFVRVGWVDVLRFKESVFRYHLQEFPTLVLFQSGHWVKAFGGPSRVEDLRDWLLTPEALEEEDPAFHVPRGARA